MKKLTIDRELFIGKLTKLIKFVPKNTVIPAFDNLLFNITPTSIRMVSADSNIQCIMICPAKATEAFDICVPAKLIFKTISLFRENEVVIKQKADSKIEVSSGKSKYNITLDCFPDGFPLMKVDSPDSEITMQQFFLKMGLRSAGNFVDEENINQNMTAININEIDSKMIFTAVSNVMMCRVAVKPIAITKWDTLNIPIAVAEKVIPLLEDRGEVTITHNGNNACFFTDSKHEDNFEVKSVSAKIVFPNSETVFKRRPVERITLNKIEFMDAIKRLKLYATPGEAPRFSMVEDGLHLKMTSADTMTEKDGEELISITEAEIKDAINKTFKNDQMLQILSNIESHEINVYYAQSDNKNIPCFIIPKVHNDEEDIFSFLVTETIA